MWLMLFNRTRDTWPFTELLLTFTKKVRRLLQLDQCASVETTKYACILAIN